jgi:capsular exopolysaccharide synthesis family protein
MSKITQALEKAARERLQREREQQEQQPTAPASPVTVALAATELTTVPVAGHVQIDPHIVTAGDPQSPVAEQYRILRTNLQSLRPRQGLKTIVMTSAVRGEGKSVTALNLALTMARQDDLKVILLDGDLRRSSVPRWLGIPNPAQGLSTALANGGSLNGSLVKLQSPRLTILPAGPVPEHPAELLESTNMRRLLAALKAQFDLVIIDSPPILSVADPGILASQADGVLLVVRAGKTQRRTVAEAQAQLQQMKAPIIGCVLTHVEHHLPGYYHYYRTCAKDKAQNGKPPHAAPTSPTVQ